jgi:hypothetical protein
MTNEDMIRIVHCHIPVEMVFARGTLKPLFIYFIEICQLELRLELLCAE